MADEIDAGAATAAAETTNTSATENTEATTSIQDTMEAVYDRMENGDRDGTGKFTSKDGADTGDAGDKAGKSADANSTDQTAAKDASGAATPTEAPKSWSDAEKAEFAKVPPDVQKAILKRETERESDYTRKTQEVATERKQYETYKPVLAPIEAEARKFNMNADVAIKQMFERHQDIAKNGIEGLKRVAAVYGLTLEGGAATDTYVDPETAALKRTVDNVVQHINGQQQAQTEQKKAAAMGEIESVRNEKTKDGAVLRPHFDTLVDDMTPIAAALKAQNPTWSPSKLAAEAYDRAVYANPETRAKLDAERQAKDKVEREKDAKEAAAKAKKAAGNNTRGSTAHVGDTGKAKSIEDTMGRVYDSLNAA